MWKRSFTSCNSVVPRNSLVLWWGPQLPTYRPHALRQLLNSSGPQFPQLGKQENYNTWVIGSWSNSSATVLYMLAITIMFLFFLNTHSWVNLFKIKRGLEKYSFLIPQLWAFWFSKSEVKCRNRNFQQTEQFVTWCTWWMKKLDPENM